MQYIYKSTRIQGLKTKRKRKKKYNIRNKEHIMRIDIEHEEIMNVMSECTEENLVKNLYLGGMT